jgi:glycosyltransferase involved in cell wall biosynthesis
MRFIILHSHYRPGGVRRVIELATPHLVRAVRPAVTEVVLASGEPPDDRWLSHFRQPLEGAKVACWIEPALGYVAEQRRSPREIQRRLRRFFDERLQGLSGNECLVWAHNQSLGRNLLLTRELARQCETRGIPLVLHHHDWWFDNRWQRWPELRRSGFRSVGQAANTLLVAAVNARHITINGADFASLRKHLGSQAGWLPNLMPRTQPPARARVVAAREWLKHQLNDQTAPVWLLPCRMLRRKNVAEALLLARWLRPEAWLVTTGGVSSADEQAYAERLSAAGHEHHWRLRMGVLAGDETRKPTVPELLAASEAVLLTSIQEGFGLPYLEAAAARRPLVARLLPNIAPDLSQFGFRFPQAYEELLVPAALFDWQRERARQERFFRDWLRLLPRTLRRQLEEPIALAFASPPSAQSFSRLTLTAQLEILTVPVKESWPACAALNPFLETWRHRAGAGKLRTPPWPRAADQWLSPTAYATRFVKLLRPRRHASADENSALSAQRELLAKTFAASNQYPLLWRSRT